MGPDELFDILGGGSGGGPGKTAAGLGLTALGGPILGALGGSITNKLFGGGGLDIDTSELEQLLAQLNNRSGLLQESQRVAVAGAPTLDSFLGSNRASNPTLGTAAAQNLAGAQGKAATRSAQGAGFNAFRTLDAQRNGQRQSVIGDLMNARVGQDSFNRNARSSQQDQVTNSVLSLLGKRYG